jgi:hypothetical protein
MAWLWETLQINQRSKAPVLHLAQVIIIPSTTRGCKSMFLIHFYTHNQREITLRAALYLPIAIRNYILKSYKFLLTLWYLGKANGGSIIFGIRALLRLKVYLAFLIFGFQTSTTTKIWDTFLRVFFSYFCNSM